MKVYILFKSGKSESYIDVDFISCSSNFFYLYFLNGDVLLLDLSDIRRFSVK